MSSHKLYTQVKSVQENSRNNQLRAISCDTIFVLFHVILFDLINIYENKLKFVRCNYKFILIKF